jgi:hypothetical protein
MVAARPCLEVGDERRWAKLGYEDQMVTGPVLMGRAIWWADSRNKIKDNRKIGWTAMEFWARFKEWKMGCRNIFSN